MRTILVPSLPSAALACALIPLGAALTGIAACQPQDVDQDGWTEAQGDCDDADPQTYPGAIERCDGLDNDCDGQAEPDSDGDGLPDCRADDVDGDGFTPAQGDCDDTSGTTHPGAPDPLADGIDQDCGGSDGPQPHVGLSTASASTLQAAIDGARPGDTIWVGPGTYVEHDLTYRGKAITLQSTHGADATVIDMAQQGRGFDFSSFETPDSVLRGFTLANGTGGTAEAGYGSGAGVFVLNASPTLDQLVIRDCSAYVGAGLYVVSGEVVVSNSSFLRNVGMGGGVYASDSVLSLSGCRFERNHGENGGAAYLAFGRIRIEDTVFQDNTADTDGGAIRADEPTLELDRCTFRRNIAGLVYQYAGGGAVAVTGQSSQVTIRDSAFEEDRAAFDGGSLNFDYAGRASISGCTVRGSSSEYGGGISLIETTATIDRCTLVGNRAGRTGGGLHHEWGFTTVTGSILAYNRAGTNGGGILSAGDWSFDHLTVVGNRALFGGGLFVWDDEETMSISNSILADNRGYDLWVSEPQYPPKLRYCALYSRFGAVHNLTEPGPGNLEADPDFVAFYSDGDGRRDDLHLLPGSPLIDAGDPLTSDTDGTRADIGAYGGDADMSYYLDADADGLYDGWEAVHGLSTSSPDAAGDPDRDGLSNLQELAGHTDPMSEDTDGDDDPDALELAAGADAIDPYVSSSGLVTLHVPEDFPTLQAAIDAVHWQADIEVSPGTWHESFLIGDVDIALRAPGGAGTTVLQSSEGSAVTAFGAELELSGFTITGGTGLLGGGLRLEHVRGTLRDLVVTGNVLEASGSFGAGMYLSLSEPRIEGCTIQGNEANYGGGMAMYSSNPTLVHSTIAGNLARSAGGHGGGIYLVDSSPVVENCVFEDNTAFSSTPGYNYIPYGVGGAVMMSGSSPSFTHCAFRGNEASYYGGAVYLYEGSNPVFSNVVFTGNGAGLSAGTVYGWSSSPVFTQVTVTGNTAPTYGGGLTFIGSDSFPRIEGSILAYNTDYNLFIGTYDGVPTPTIRYNDLYSPPGQNNYYYGALDATNLLVEPGFLVYDGGLPADPHLATTSLLTDAGSPDALDPDGTRAAMGSHGGPQADGFDLDGDGSPDWFWPGGFDDVPDGVDSDAFDCDDSDPAAAQGKNCPTP